MGVPRLHRLAPLSAGRARIGPWVQPLAERSALFVCLAAVYLATLAPGLTWSHNGADGGGLIAAAAVGGAAHPPGYPSYLLLARLFQLIPAGSLAFRTNLLSAACAALAGVFAAAAAESASLEQGRLGRLGGWLAGLGLGLAPLLWAQAVIAEVYALHALFSAALLYAFIARGAWRAGSLALGLALGNHLTIAAFLPIWLAVLLRGGDGSRWRRLLEGAAWLALGLAVYLYLPLRARAMPPVNWGAADTWSGLVWLVTGEIYQPLAFSLPGPAVWERVKAAADLAFEQFGPAGLVVALGGLFLAGARPVLLRPAAVWLVVSSAAFAIGYGTSDSASYLLPAVAVMAVWLGVGASAGLAWLGARGRALPLLAAAGLLGALLLNAAWHWPAMDARDDRRAEEFGQAVLAGAPAGAIVFTAEDRDTFALWYFHFALGRRPDLVVISEPLLAFDWYLAGLRATYPGLALPPAAEVWPEDIAALNPRPICRTRVDAAQPVECGAGGE